ncbi:MAG: right-handed parallel beta-helix repeat-containing protein [Armatimonadota bacterium]
MELFVATNGNDAWSGGVAEPNAAGTDGPLATLEKARDAVRGLKAKGLLAGPVTVQVRGGIYSLAKPLTFTPEDSAPVTYAAYPGETPIIDGGMRIDGWQVEEVNGVTAWVVELPAVAQGAWYFHSLFVNGERRRRPRLPKDGFYRIVDSPGAGFTQSTNLFRSKPGDIRQWKNLTDVEAIVLHLWVDEHMPLASFDEDTCTVTTSRWSIFGLKEDWRTLFAKYYVENIFEALTEPGEWYLDRPTGKLYYLPLPGEDPQTTAVYAPKLTQLLKIAGKPDEGRYVEFLRFEGLTFRHADAVRPAAKDDPYTSLGYSNEREYASAPQAANHVPGVLSFEGARNCAIENCIIEHLGWYAIGLEDGCMGNRIVGNEIGDIGGGGVRINGSDFYGSLARRTGNNRITDNHIHHTGRVFHQSVGVFCKHTFGNTVAHNHIHDLFYSGISCGWVWGYADNISKDNHLDHNHIHHLGFGWLSDMGGIYTLGVQPGTTIRGNLIHDVERASYGGWAVYLDEGSSHLVVEDNVCYNTTSESFHNHYGRENIIRNNIFSFATDGLVALNRAENHLSFTFERNILITDGPPIYSGGYACKLDDPHFSADLNLLWQTDGRPPTSRNAGGEGTDDPDANRITMEQMQAWGYDLHSQIADPHCADLANRDFTLAKDSPAFALGFKPIDLSSVGPRAEEERE